MSLQYFLDLPTRDFERTVWGQRHWLTTVDRRAAAEPLFDEAAVNALISQRALRTPFVRVASNGTVAPTASFSGGAGLGARVGDQVRDEDLVRLMAGGSTVVLQAVHRLWEPVGSVARALATELGHPVQVNAYITPPGGQGFSAHYDTHDVVVLQCAGAKRWTLHPPVVEHPMADDPWTDHRDEVAKAAIEEPVAAFELGAGDALYLPAGFIHAAEAADDISIHLTFGIHAVRRVDVMRDLMEATLARFTADPAMRTPLPPGWSADVRAVVEPLRATAANGIADLSDADVDAALAERRARDAGRPAPLEALRQVAAAQSPEQVERVQARAGVQWRWGAVDHRPAIVTVSRTIPVDPDWIPTVDLMLGGAVVAVSAVTIDPAIRTSILGLLLAEGLVVPVPEAIGHDQRDD